MSITAEALLDHFRPGAVIWIPGASGELVFLRALLAAEPERMRGVTLVSALIPGVNDFDYAALHPEARLRVFMMASSLRGSFEAGRVELMPLCYSDTAAYLQDFEPDLAILHLTPPENGLCSFGVAADFGPIIAASAKMRIGIINRRMPRPMQGPTWPIGALDAVLEIDDPILTAPATPLTPELKALAAHVANLVPDRAAVQAGIGAAPGAIWRALGSHRGLTLRSGMVTDGVMAAFEAGAMAERRHVTGVALGSQGLLDWLPGTDQLAFADVFSTHGAEALAGVARFTAINSALEIDLYGQANLEWQGGHAISGVGGAPDFMRAARRSPGGRSILAIPATAKSGAVSRIVARLSAPTVSLPRTDADTVVTEHGVAELRGLNVEDRAKALIAIAEPAQRDALAAQWRDAPNVAEHMPKPRIVTP